MVNTNMLKNSLDDMIDNIKCISIVLPTSGWTGDAAPYTNTATVDKNNKSLSWMTATWQPCSPEPDMDYHFPDGNVVWNTYVTLKDEYTKLSFVTSCDGSIVVTAEDLPTVDLALRIHGAVERG